MRRTISPFGLAPPAANYAHAVVSEAPGAVLWTSGVVPVEPGGAVPQGLAAQAEVVWANLAAIVAEAEMGPADVVSVTTYVVAAETDLQSVMAARDRYLGDTLAASTLVTVPRLVHPEWLVEAALVAVRSGAAGGEMSASAGTQVSDEPASASSA